MCAARTEAVIDRLGAQGDGVAQTPEGPVFVPRAAPGDRARFSVTLAKAGVRRGADVAIIEEGPERATPFCAHFGACGGCAVQHVADETLARWKRALVVDALQKRGFHGPPVTSAATSPRAARRRAKLAWAGGALGFKEARGPRIIDLANCPILTPRLQAVLPALREVLIAADLARADIHVTWTETGLDLDIAGDAAEARLIAVVGERAEALALARLTIDGAPGLLLASPQMRFGDVSVEPPPRAFLQATMEGEGALAEAAMEWTVGAKRIADLFSGIGTFGLRLAGAATVAAYDGDAASVAALDAAARGARGLKPVTATRRDLFRRPLSAKELALFDAVIFDPPRAGAKAQADAIAQSGVARVIAVSCDPGSFARDARILVDGGYVLMEARPVDQFRYAAHVEIVALFIRP